MKKLIPLAAALALLMQASAEDRSPAEQLGWTLAVHSYTFQKFPIFEAIDKTAAVGAKHMSISGSVNLPGADGKFKPSSTIGLSLKDAAVINARMKEKGLDTTFVNMCVVEKLAKEYNIKVATRNHPGPKNFYWKPDTVAAAVKGSSELLGSCADVGHWVRSGLDPVECLKRLEGRVIALHFKDLNERSPKAHDVQLGQRSQQHERHVSRASAPEI